MANEEIIVDQVPSASSNLAIENTLVKSLPRFPAAGSCEKTLSLTAGNLLQTLVCLTDLMLSEADPAVIGKYAKLSQAKLQSLCELLGPMLWTAS